MLTLIPILAALGSGIAFATMQVVMKRLSLSNQPIFSVLHLMGYLCPVWAALFIITDATGALTFTLTPQALLFPVGWAILATGTTSIMMLLFRKFSLTEMMGYRKALVTFGSMGVDVVLFAQHFPPLKLAAIVLLLVGAVFLSHSCRRLPTIKEVLILVVWCSLFVVQVTLYKEGQQHQTHILSNTILAQLCSTFIYAAFGLFIPKQPGNTAAPILSIPLLSLMVGLAFVGTAVEGFAYAGLPLAIVQLLTILPGTLFAAHDLWNGHIARSPRTFGALAALGAGFTLLMLAH